MTCVQSDFKSCNTYKIRCVLTSTWVELGVWVVIITCKKSDVYTDTFYRCAVSKVRCILSLLTWEQVIWLCAEVFFTGVMLWLMHVMSSDGYLSLYLCVVQILQSSFCNCNSLMDQLEDQRYFVLWCLFPVWLELGQKYTVIFCLQARPKLMYKIAFKTPHTFHYTGPNETVISVIWFFVYVYFWHVWTSIYTAKKRRKCRSRM